MWISKIYQKICKSLQYVNFKNLRKNVLTALISRFQKFTKKLASGPVFEFQKSTKKCANSFSIWISKIYKIKCKWLQYVNLKKSTKKCANGFSMQISNFYQKTCQQLQYVNFKNLRKNVLMASVCECLLFDFALCSDTGGASNSPL